MLRDTTDKKTIVAVIGLGYVGLPVALAFARKGKVIGFDIDARRVDMMQQGIMRSPLCKSRQMLFEDQRRPSCWLLALVCLSQIIESYDEKTMRGLSSEVEQASSLDL